VDRPQVRDEVAVHGGSVPFAGRTIVSTVGCQLIHRQWSIIIRYITQPFSTSYTCLATLLVYLVSLVYLTEHTSWTVLPAETSPTTTTIPIEGWTRECETSIHTSHIILSMLSSSLKTQDISIINPPKSISFNRPSVRRIRGNHPAWNTLAYILRSVR
jgi:hypothetical protein